MIGKNMCLCIRKKNDLEFFLKIAPSGQKLSEQVDKIKKNGYI